MRPFLLLSIRAEPEAALEEEAAFRRFLEVGPEDLVRRRLGPERLDVRLEEWSGIVLGGGAFTTTDPVEGLLNRTWKPTLSVTGADGFPALKDAGNVLRPYTAFKLSLRLPPLVDAGQAVQELKALLEDNAPYQAKVTFEGGGGATGWNAPTITPWFERALDAASLAHFGAPCGYIGQGGTIPLMNMLSEGFPKAQMMVCGVLGPKSNAHGPNEFLHVPYAKKLTAAVAEVIAALPAAHRAENLAAASA